ncbi:zinc-binding alcohol dehydrogenase family protein [bacterium]|nr:zinc-binding alcohol dehydrogenase family protein [bacterium]
MRVLAYYGKSDIRDEEWPRPKKIPQGSVRVAVRAVTLGEAARSAYLSGGMAAPSPVGQYAAGIVEESAEESFPRGTPVLLWSDDASRGGLAEESLVWPAERICALPKALSYPEMTLLPLWAELLSALEGLPDGNGTVLGEGPQLEMIKALTPHLGAELLPEGQEAAWTILLRADDKLLEKAMMNTRPGGTILILSTVPGAALGNLPLALEKRFCFNFGAVCQKRTLEKVFSLTSQGGLSLVCGNKLFSWDQADEAFFELEKGSFVTLYQESFDEPYFP